ncbi:ribokinase [Thalassospira sp.]|uniref:ribokinase n=1 Tax=Thalassospira sp. TaxID=1912094 RepID=UPI00273702A5|nr:ribokinase [Thalassospira sp.]MDP2698812.1 ribokinase [Thalassospira sp.]
MSIAIIGSANMDIAARAADLPVPGQTILADSCETGPGGKGCNQAIAVHRLGAKTRLIAKIGDDTMGKNLLAALQHEGLDTDHIIQGTDIQTGIALITVDRKGENMITVAGGANMTLTRQDIRNHYDFLSGCTCLLVQLECPVVAIASALKYAREEGIATILDPSPVLDRVVMRDLIALADIITPNSSECAALTGIIPKDAATAQQAADILHEMGCPTVIIKMGALGAWYSAPDGNGKIAPFQVVPVDTVAAGDCFNAGLAVALKNGNDLAKAVRFACAAGALATTEFGAASSAPYLHQVETLLNNSHA